MESITQEQALQLVRDTIRQLDDVRLHFTLRKLRVKWLYKGQVDTLKACLALYKLGIPITCPAVAAVLQQNPAIVLSELHTLGDKHLLVLKRGAVSGQRWLPHQLLLEEMQL